MRPAWVATGWILSSLLTAGCNAHLVVPMTIVPEPPPTAAAPLKVGESELSIGGSAQTAGGPVTPADPDLGRVGEIIPRYQYHMAMRTRQREATELAMVARITDWAGAYPSVRGLPEPRTAMHSGELGLAYRLDIDTTSTTRVALHATAHYQLIEVAVYECECYDRCDAECSSVSDFVLEEQTSQGRLGFGFWGSASFPLGPTQALTPVLGVQSFQRSVPTFREGTANLSASRASPLVVYGAFFEQDWDPFWVSFGLHHPLNFSGPERLSLTANLRVGVRI